jgi:DMSO/TMAO reductase YedYZ molybdopterin-dependent catalytic subunit
MAQRRTGRTTLHLSRRALLAGLVGASAGQALGLWGGLARAVEPSAPAAQDDSVLQPSSRAPGELASLVTPSGAFYYVTKNPLSDPVIAADAWELRVEGEVGSPVRLNYAILQQLPPVQIGKTLECISNRIADCEVAPFGCELIGNAIWTGASLSDVLNLAGGLSGSAAVLDAIGADEFTSVIPADAAADPETILAYEMNGQPLPQNHGAPVRLLAPGRYGFKSAKWIVGIRARNARVPDWYGLRGWNRDGIVKTMSRIDVPAPGATLTAGTQRIAGIAYAGDRGISAVEFSADGGASWQPASFVEPQLGRDTWVRWEGSFDLPSGATLELVSRATDGTGRLQTQQVVLPEPDGGSGWRRIEVSGA